MPETSKSITVPIGEINAEEYCSDHVEVRLSRQHSASLKQLRRGLERCGARLGEGQYVKSNADVVRWLLDQISAA